jgi:hypothetical protein
LKFLGVLDLELLPDLALFFFDFELCWADVGYLIEPLFGEFNWTETPIAGFIC